jgi:DNA (cytosine-5)-methyltransferase 1
MKPVTSRDKSPAGSANKDQALSHRDALNVILRAEADGVYSEAIRQELPAIIGHWLQSPESAPLVLGEDAGLRWRRILADASELPRNASNSIGSRQPSMPKIKFSGIFLPPPADHQFTFIDLFAGIGGFRQSLQSTGGKCVFSSEWDNQAKETYLSNYGETPFGDIKLFTENDDAASEFSNAIPHHDVLAGGFPCQAFSRAGKQLGFNEARGTLFFEVLKIVRAKRPKVVFLENVKRLKTHDQGNTMRVIVSSLYSLGYKVYAKVLQARDFGVPQNRERIFIVAFDKALDFQFPKPPNLKPSISIGSIMEEEVDPWYTISDLIYEGHKRRRRNHESRGNGFGYAVFKPEDTYTNTISARYWKDGSEILIFQDGKNPRKLTPRECARLQGFPEEFIPHHMRRHAYQQFGNSVAVPVVKAVAEQIVKALADDIPAQGFLDPFEPVID